MRQLMALADLGATIGFAYHYTKAATALEQILPSMTLQLGPIADTNDPSECQTPGAAVGWPNIEQEVEGLFDRIRAVSDEVRNAIRRARVACLSVDERTEDKPTPDYLRLGEGASSSGWARDRMWAQYADGHRGMCLLFDREKLVEAFHDALADRGKCLSREVEYKDKVPRLPHVELREAIRDPGAYALAYRDDHVHARYFLKRRDWEGEREFRLVLLDDRGPPSVPALVPIRNALVAIMVGHRFPTAYLPCIEHICSESNIPTFQFRYSSMWPYPRAVPYGLGEPPPGP